VEGLQWWIDEIDEKRYISLIQDREDLETAQTIYHLINKSVEMWKKID